MVWLARAVYEDKGSDPAELLALPGQAETETHLLPADARRFPGVLLGPYGLGGVLAVLYRLWTVAYVLIPAGVLTVLLVELTLAVHDARCRIHHCHSARRDRRGPAPHHE